MVELETKEQFNLSPYEGAKTVLFGGVSGFLGGTAVLAVWDAPTFVTEFFSPQGFGQTHTTAEVIPPPTWGEADTVWAGASILGIVAAGVLLANRFIRYRHRVKQWIEDEVVLFRHDLDEWDDQARRRS